MTNTLTYFRVDGAWRDVEEHIPSQAGIAPQIDDVSAYVDFFPGTQLEAISQGYVFLAPNYETYGDTEIALAPITGRTINARLCTIAVGDPNGIQLVANSAWMDLDEPLFYHVRYRNVTYGGALQRFSNFAFQAPVDVTGVLLTSTTLTRYEYRGP
jgi:hypothetical protein